MSAERQLPRLPDAELEVMQALWELGAYPAHTGGHRRQAGQELEGPHPAEAPVPAGGAGLCGGEQGGADQQLHAPGGAGGLSGQREPLLPGAGARGFLSSLMAALYPDTGLSREDMAELERILERGAR